MLHTARSRQSYCWA